MREGTDTAGVSWNRDRDPSSWQIVSQTREKLRKEQHENLSLEVKSGMKRQHMWLEDRVLPVGLMMSLRRLVGSDLWSRF